MNKTVDVNLSKTEKLIVIEMLLFFFCVVFIASVKHGVFYLLFSPGLPLIFVIAFLINGLFFEKELILCKLMFFLNLFLFALLTYTFWFSGIFNNFR